MPLTDAQKKLRLTGICSSDIAAVIGVNPYRGALDVYRIKTGQVESPNLDGKMCVRLGHLLEPFIANEYVAVTGTPLVDGGTHGHVTEEWMFATPDRIALGPDGRQAYIVELKTVGCRQARRWTDEDALPQEYQAQVRWQMAVMDFDRCDVAALIGNEDILIHTIHRDADIERTMIEAARAFWLDNVLARVEPRAGGTEADGRALIGLHPRANGSLVQADIYEDQIALKLKGVRGQKARIMREELELKNLLKQSIGDADGIETSDGTIRWRGDKVRRFTVPRDWNAPMKAPEKIDRLDGQGDEWDMYELEPETWDKWRAALDAGHEDKARRIMARFKQEQIEGDSHGS